MENDRLARLETRRGHYHRLNAHLTLLSEAQLNKLITATDSQAGGTGIVHTLRVQGVKIFVKRLPLTRIEFEHPFDTRNHYALPVYYNYGVGSAGFGAYRELVTHIRTTNWVLLGEIENFPLLYGYRILPRLAPPVKIVPTDRAGYRKHWNGSKEIDRYFVARLKAPYELILFLEHFPFSFYEWLAKNQAQTTEQVRLLRDTIAFLRGRGVIHFDAHFNNIVSDGERPYLTDFGLALDRGFDLSPEELAFYKKHLHYDYGEMLASLGWILYGVHQRLPRSKKKRLNDAFGSLDELPGAQRLAVLLDRLEEIHALGWMDLDPDYVETARRCEGVIQYMTNFLIEMRRNERKDTAYSDRKLKILLKESSFLL